MQYRVLAFHVTTFISPSAWYFFPISFKVLAINDLAWMLPAVLSVSTRTTYIRLEVSLPIDSASNHSRHFGGIVGVSSGPCESEMSLDGDDRTKH